MTTPQFLPFALPDIGDAEIQAVTNVMRSGWLTTGEEVKAFEKEFAEAVGATHAIALNSCTAALHLALDAIGLQAGDEVIVPAMTFAATAEVVRYFNGVPVIVDVDPARLTIDPVCVRRALGPKTRAIIVVHMGGYPADMAEIWRLANQHDVRVIEDAAHALPTKFNGRLVGSMSDFTCFSFYATKTLTTGEGGMLCTERADWADRCRIMSLHGISRDAWKRYSSTGSWYYEIVDTGYKYNLTDIAAAIGRVQLAKLESMTVRRRVIADRYRAAFAASDALQAPLADEEHHSNAWHLFTLRLNLNRLRVSRDVFIDELREKGVSASVHFIPLHVHPYYRERFNYSPESCPVAYREYTRIISLPIYSAMADDDVQRVIDSVLTVTRRHLIV